MSHTKLHEGSDIAGERLSILRQSVNYNLGMLPRKAPDVGVSEPPRSFVERSDAVVCNPLLARITIRPWNSRATSPPTSHTARFTRPNLGGVSDIPPAQRSPHGSVGQPSRLRFGTIDRILGLHLRGAFWRLLAALQIQLNRSPSSTPARQRFSLAGLFRSCSRRPAPPYHVAI